MDDGLRRFIRVGAGADCQRGVQSGRLDLVCQLRVCAARVHSGAYLGLALQAHRADDVVQRRSDVDIAALILAALVHLGVVLDLHMGVSAGRTDGRGSGSAYLSTAGAVAVDWRGVDGGRIRTRRGLQVVRGIGRSGGFH